MEDGASDVESEFESESAISLAKWWTVLGFPDRERLEQTLKCTTQRHMLPKQLQLKDHHVRRTPLGMGRRRLPCCVASDPAFFVTKEGVKTIGNRATCVQVFYCKHCHHMVVVPLKKEGNFMAALKYYLSKYLPRTFRVDGANLEKTAATKEVLNGLGVAFLPATPGVSNQSWAETGVRILTSMVHRTMAMSKAPKGVFLYCVVFCAQVHNLTATRYASSDFLGRVWKTPSEAHGNGEPDLSNLRFGFWERVRVLDRKAKVPDPKEWIGHYLGLDEDHGDAYTYVVYNPGSKRITTQDTIDSMEGVTFAEPPPARKRKGAPKYKPFDPKGEIVDEATKALVVGAAAMRTAYLGLSRRQERIPVPRVLQPSRVHRVHTADRELTEEQQLFGKLEIKHGQYVPSSVPMAEKLQRFVTIPGCGQRWTLSFQREVDAMWERDVYTRTKLSRRELLALGYQEVPMIVVLDIKPRSSDPKKFQEKTRIVLGGHVTHSAGLPTAASVSRFDSLRILLAIATIMQLSVFQLDVSTAYLYAKTLEKIFVKATAMFGEDVGKLLIVNKACYGLTTSAREWAKMFGKYIMSLGFQRSRADECLFFLYKNGELMIISVYVDDNLGAGSSPNCNAYIRQIRHRFKCTAGILTDGLGMQFVRNGLGPIGIHMDRYISDLIDSYERVLGKEIRLRNTPVVESDHP